MSKLDKAERGIGIAGRILTMTFAVVGLWDRVKRWSNRRSKRADEAARHAAVERSKAAERAKLKTPPPLPPPPEDKGP